MSDADREARHDWLLFQKEHSHDNEPEPRDLDQPRKDDD